MYKFVSIIIRKKIDSINKKRNISDIKAKKSNDINNRDVNILCFINLCQIFYFLMNNFQVLQKNHILKNPATKLQMYRIRYMPIAR